MRRKNILVTIIGCTVIMFGSIGVSNFLVKQNPIVLETVNDEVETTATQAAFDVDAKGAVLIDADTGKVLFEKDSHKELPLASVTKVMTMLLVMEDVESGKISLKDEVTISERAASMGGSQMYMEVGEKHTVEELLKGVAMASANDGCVALAEYVAGTEEIFVERMNQRAKELGMRDSHFVNTNGLPVADHYSSAYDIAVMSKELYQYEETRKWFTTWQDSITVGLPGKEKEFGLTNTNKLIKQYDGCNGIKTGFTSDAGYCLSASATRGETHLIAVALGCETSAKRNQEIAKVLDYGFATYETTVIAKKGQVMETISIERGDPQKVQIVTEDKITALVKKGQEDKITSQVVLEEKVKLPIAKGDQIGKLVLYDDGKKIGEYPLVSKGNIKKESILHMIKRHLKIG
ncbi:MAG: D-alanyl-D-alanine carboxypeptidase [Firmicutes bacterium]|nr:D-alanyl-D-alanine carboxypeptidase [Bacillota bacterium]